MVQRLCFLHCECVKKRNRKRRTLPGVQSLLAEFAECLASRRRVSAAAGEEDSPTRGIPPLSSVNSLCLLCNKRL